MNNSGLIKNIATLVLLALENAGLPLFVTVLLIFENSGVFLKHMSLLKLLPKRALIPAETTCVPLTVVKLKFS